MRIVQSLVVVALMLAMGAAAAPKQAKDHVKGSSRAKEKGAMTADSSSEKAAAKGADLEEASFKPKTEAEWKRTLTPEQYRVTRLKGTEKPFTGQYYQTKDEGVYRCVCCGAPLFTSETKFEAHCGWPSFFKPLEDKKLKFLDDRTYGMRRIEVQCQRCGAHLGHVFDDGPKPTGLRYCINSASLKFEPKNAAEKATEKKPAKE